MIIVSCTVYAQGVQCCADASGLIALRDHPLRHHQHVLHRRLLSHLALPRNSPLLPQPFPITSHCIVCPVSLSTSTHHYSYLIKLSLTFFITPWRSRFLSLHLPLLVSIVVRCGDIHTNSGTPALSLFFLPLHLQYPLSSLYRSRIILKQFNRKTSL